MFLTVLDLDEARPPRQCWWQLRKRDKRIADKSAGINSTMQELSYLSSCSGSRVNLKALVCIVVMFVHCTSAQHPGKLPSAPLDTGRESCRRLSVHKAHQAVAKPVTMELTSSVHI